MAAPGGGVEGEGGRGGGRGGGTDGAGEADGVARIATPFG